jgi:hypothetical protein
MFDQLHRPRSGPAVQAKPDAYEGPIRRPAAVQLRPAAVQAKLAIGQPDDPAEVEADHIADAVVHGRAAPGPVARPQGISRSPDPTSPNVPQQVSGTVGATGGTGGTTPADVVRSSIDLTAIGEDKGIRVAIAFGHDVSAERPGKVAAFKGGTLRAALNSLWVQIGWLPEIISLKAALDKEDADGAKATPPVPPTARTPTDTEAGTLADAVFKNDAAFVANAGPHAKLRHSIGGPPPTVDTFIKYTPTEDPFTKVTTVSNAIGPLATNPTAIGGGTPLPGGVTPADPTKGLPSGVTAGPAVSAGTGNIAELAVFTHGTHHGMGFGGAGWLDGGAAASKIAPLAAPQVSVQLYGCSSAAKDKEDDPNEQAFAQKLATSLAEQGHDARTFGHLNAGPTVENPFGREFVASTDAHGGYIMVAAKNYDICFPDTFVKSETTRLATALGTTADVVSGVFDRVSRAYFRGAINRVLVPAAGGGKALYTIGFARTETAAAVQADWQLPTQGEKLMGADAEFQKAKKAAAGP